MHFSWPSFESQKLFVRALILVIAIGVDFVMFLKLVTGLAGGDLQPAVAAIIGTMVGAITTLITLGGKDFFGDVGGNGRTPAE